MRLASWLGVGVSCLALACGSDPIDSQQSPGPEPQSQLSPDALAVASLLGTSGGQQPSFLPIYDAASSSRFPLYPTALAFNPVMPDELWITLRQPLTDQACDMGEQTGCDWLVGRVAIVSGAGAMPDTAPDIQLKQDANAWHFMRRPTSISFGDDDTFGTCAEARTSNYEDESIPFNGPVLWSADPAIFGVAPPPNSPTGSTHIDMLHESPYCMGIAHERDNVYWTFNGDAGSLDRYDFHAPHEPGGDDHSDGELERYAPGAVLRVPEVPSHLVFDPDSALLYAADSGNGRLVALDTTAGTPKGEVTTYDPIVTHVMMSGAKLYEVVARGRLQMPSGVALYQGVLFVTDNATSRIFAFDPAGHTLATLDTGLPVGSLAGITVGPDGHAYFVDQLSRRVLRIDPAEAP